MWCINIQLLYGSNLLYFDHFMNFTKTDISCTYTWAKKVLRAYKLKWKIKRCLQPKDIDLKAQLHVDKVLDTLIIPIL